MAFFGIFSINPEQMNILQRKLWYLLVVMRGTLVGKFMNIMLRIIFFFEKWRIFQIFLHLFRQIIHQYRLMSCQNDPFKRHTKQKLYYSTCKCLRATSDKPFFARFCNGKAF